MSERTVRIPTEALAQRLNRIEERVRALSLRAWPGAVRTALESRVDVDDFDPSAWVPLVSITVESGRWMVFAHATLAVSPQAAGSYNLQMFLWASDPATGVRISNPSPGSDDEPGGPNAADFHFVKRVAHQSGLSTSGTSYVPIAMIGDFTSEDIVVITLGANNFSGDPFFATDAQLMLVPV